MKCKLVSLALMLVVGGCVTPAAGTSQEGQGGAGLGAADDESGGYFVALAATGSGAETLALYDGLHDAIDAYNRKLADKQGQLPAYVEAFKAEGYTRLADGDNEIECDLNKCLVKLTGRTLVAKADDKRALAWHLTHALSDHRAAPERSGKGNGQTRTYTLGTKAGLHITCSQKGLEPSATYRCDFDLTRGQTMAPAAQALEPASRGRLVSCVLSPGTVRSAEEAKAELDGGELLELTQPAAGGKAVGYLRYARQGNAVEFVDLFLCGDLSHDFFVVEGAAKAPRAWLATPAKVGGAGMAIESIHDDEARLVAAATVLEESADAYTLEVRFRLERNTEAPLEVYGDDRFQLRLRKAWTAKN